MNTKKIIKRLEEIMGDLPMEAMRQGRELDELIEELKNPKPRVRAERGFIQATWDQHILYYNGTGQWTRRIQEAHVYPTLEDAAKFFGGPGYEIYPVIRNKHGKLRRLFT